jgi:hypothetical protein
MLQKAGRPRECAEVRAVVQDLLSFPRHLSASPLVKMVELQGYVAMEVFTLAYLGGIGALTARAHSLGYASWPRQ